MKTLPGMLHSRTGLRWLVLVAMMYVSVTRAASVAGRVIEDGTDLPLKGVSVKAKMPAGAAVPETITDTKGEYRLDGLPAGKVEIEFSRPDYLIDPTMRLLEVNAEKTPVDEVVLFRRTEDPAYLVRVADRIVRLAAGNADEAAKRWQWYDGLPIAYSSKVRIAQAVVQKDQRLAAVPAYARLKAVDIAKVVQFEKQLDEVRTRPAAAAHLSSDLPTPLVNGVIESAVKRLPAAERGRFERAVSERRAGKM